MVWLNSGPSLTLTTSMVKEDSSVNLPSYTSTVMFTTGKVSKSSLVTTRTRPVVRSTDTKPGGDASMIVNWKFSWLTASRSSTLLPKSNITLPKGLSSSSVMLYSDSWKCGGLSLMSSIYRIASAVEYIEGLVASSATIVKLNISSPASKSNGLTMEITPVEALMATKFSSATDMFIVSFWDKVVLGKMSQNTVFLCPTMSLPCVTLG